MPRSKKKKTTKKKPPSLETIVEAAAAATPTPARRRDTSSRRERERQIQRQVHALRDLDDPRCHLMGRVMSCAEGVGEALRTIVLQAVDKLGPDVLRAVQPAIADYLLAADLGDEMDRLILRAYAIVTNALERVERGELGLVRADDAEERRTRHRARIEAAVSSAREVTLVAGPDQIEPRAARESTTPISVDAQPTTGGASWRIS